MAVKSPALDVRKYKILSSQDSKTWRTYLHYFPEKLQDVFFLPEYYALYETDDVKAECFVYQDDDRIIFYPYLKTKISLLGWAERNGSYYDIEGAYGYNGILSNTKDGAFQKEFNQAFAQFCRDHRIVAEFMRLNPLYQNDLVCDDLQLEQTNKNVIVDLSLSEEELWSQSYEHCVRKNIKKAQSHHIHIRSFWGNELEDDLLTEFLNIYYHTMDRYQTEKVYYFPKTYFKNLGKKLGKNSLFFFAFQNGKVVSCELVLLGSKIGYSFLGGTLEQYNLSRPNNLLKHEIIRELKKLSFQFYCIGGGRQPNDGIYRYKKTFAKNGEVDFCIGKRIHNPEVYDSLCRAWVQQFPEKEKTYKNYFLKYKF